MVPAFFGVCAPWARSNGCKFRTCPGSGKCKSRVDGFHPVRCAQQAVTKALEMMNDGHSRIIDVDPAKFFDTVNHDKLMTIFGRTIKDGDLRTVKNLPDRK